MILAGPLMPLDVATGTSQHQTDWLSRGAFFLAVGPFFSAMVIGLRRAWEHELAIIEQEREMAIYKANILQNLSHELRTPLTVILGTAKMLTARRLVSGEALSLMEAVLRAAQRLEEMILVALAASGAKERRKRNLQCEIKSMVDSICASLRELNALERVHLEPGAEKGKVTTDPEILTLMLRCLIDNALKFSPPDTPVSVRYQKGDSTVEIVVKDLGPGLDEEYAKQAFEAFTQEDQSTRRTQGGLGIGLYAARKLAEEIKGEVDLVRPTEGGTEAVIRIPQLREVD